MYIYGSMIGIKIYIGSMIGIKIYIGSIFVEVLDRNEKI